ncbi:MAG: histidine phosphatase family protein, partial [Patescibacteria group bacterium]
MKIYIRKTFKYNPCHSGLPKYESYEAVTRQTYSPEIIMPEKHEKFDLPTFCSSLIRCVQTAKATSCGKTVELDDLREIKFSLHDLVSKKEFETDGSVLVRKRFIEAFIKDTLLESRTQTKKRMDSLLKKLKNLPDRDYLLVSHSFYMKILQGYLCDKELFRKPRLLRKYFDPLVKTFENGEGFEFDV